MEVSGTEYAWFMCPTCPNVPKKPDTYRRICSICGRLGFLYAEKFRLCLGQCIILSLHNTPNVQLKIFGIIKQIFIPVMFVGTICQYQHKYCISANKFIIYKSPGNIYGNIDQLQPIYLFT